jgi:hypothetical protein
MRKILLIISIALAAINTNQAQTFAPVGAEWLYESVSSLGPPSYHHLYVSGTTNFEGKQCSVIKGKAYISGVDIWPSYNQIEIDSIIVYNSNDTVFYYNSNQFIILYNFNVETTDTIIVHGERNILNDCDTISLNSVDTVDFENINNLTLKYYTLSDLKLDNGGWSFGKTMYIFDSDLDPLGIKITGFEGTRIYQKMGNITYLLPRKLTDSCGSDPMALVNYNIRLVCYRDNEMEYKYNNFENCIDISKLTKLSDLSVKNIEIYPNPFKDYLSFRFKDEEKPSEIRVFNSLGTKVLNVMMRDINAFEKMDNVTINLSELKNGVYFIVFYFKDSETRNQSYKIIKL